MASNVFTAPEIASVGWSQSEIEAGLVRGEIEKVIAILHSSLTREFKTQYNCFEVDNRLPAGQPIPLTGFMLQQLDVVSM